MIRKELKNYHQMIMMMKLHVFLCFYYIDEMKWKPPEYCVPICADITSFNFDVF